MIKKTCYHSFIEILSEDKKGFAILIDPDHFSISDVSLFFKNMPDDATHIFVGGSEVGNGETEATVKAIKKKTSLPILLFPGDENQITDEADGILYLSLLSGRNPEYLIGKHVQAIPKIRNTSLEVISMGYLLIDGGSQSAVQRVSNTKPMPQNDIPTIVNTALAGEYQGAKLIYLEAGSGAKYPVKEDIISAVKKEISVPLIVGGGIRTDKQRQIAYGAGADIVVMGTAFEIKNL